MDDSPVTRKREIIITLAVLLVTVAIVAAVTVANKKSPDSAVTATNTPAKAANAAPSADPSAGAATNANYKDGSYSAIGSYDSPGGNEHITINVTLANGAVTATSAKSGAGDPEAAEYQNAFISGYKQQVVGKAISSVSLSRVSGSSLTSQGFNNALAQIKQQAQA
jgi:hypothetical protein